MAKKATSKETTPPAIVVEEAVVIETPAELVPIVQASNLPEVQKTLHLATFVPVFKSIVDLETEFLEVGDDPVKAKELRDKYRGERGKAEDFKKAAKADLLEEGRFIDKIFNTLDTACKAKEGDLKAIETAEETRKENARTALKVSRKALLDAEDYDTEFLTLEDMPEESFNRLLEKARGLKSNQAGADQAKADQEKADQARKDEFNRRVLAMHAVGLGFNIAAEGYQSEDGFIANGMVGDGTAEAFEIALQAVQVKYNNRKQEEADKVKAANDAKDRIKNRINAITGLGLILDTSTVSYKGFGQSMTADDVENLSGDDFTERFALIKDLVTSKKTADKKKADEQAAETKRLKDAEDKRKADQKTADEAKAKAALAPDVDKLRALYVTLKNIEYPVVTAPEALALLNVTKQGIAATMKYLAQEAAKLK